ncbi:MAG: acetyl-CoA acetyltransferase [Chloroflexi bacterium]|nr:acetyl-CoA acetyltransferase [Chloroflexota bacterium]PKB57090.1 MAG: thiolase [SAR202 cluster bacterium Casp-Chloro-G3]
MSTSTSRQRDIAIVGVAESDVMGTVPNKSSLQHHAEAAHNALEDAGLAKSDINGLLTAGFSTLATAEYMGIQPSFTDNTSVGGSSFVIHVAHAAAAIRAGYCDTVLITHGQAGRSTRARVPVDPNLPVAQYEAPYGLVGQPINYSMACTRYMHEYGEDRTRQAMAEIAVSTRKWANLNPKAAMHDTSMSFDEYHDSRWVSWPFHLFDCCLVTDSGAAIIVTTAEKAASCRKQPVWLLGAAESHDHNIISAMPSFTSLIARETGPKAMGRAGIKHDDIDLTMIYDSFTYTVMLTLEGLGFCKQGEAADFVANQRTAPGGDFALNTNGGGLSYTHPGMYGSFLLVEAVRQLRGECGDRQVKHRADPTQNAKLAIVNGTGGSLSSTGTVVLATD